MNKLPARVVGGSVLMRLVGRISQQGSYIGFQVNPAAFWDVYLITPFSSSFFSLGVITIMQYGACVLLR